MLAMMIRVLSVMIQRVMRRGATDTRLIGVTRVSRVSAPT